MIGIPHPKIDDVLPTMPSLKLEGLDLCKHIGRKALETVKFVHGSSVVDATIADQDRTGETVTIVMQHSKFSQFILPLEESALLGKRSGQLMSDESAPGLELYTFS